MPRINLPKKKSYNNYRWKHSSKRTNLIHKYVYNTRRWRELRVTYLMANPLCERCYEKKLIVSGIDVHHKMPISTAGKNIEEIKRLGFDVENLMTLCKEHHIEEHKIIKNSK